MHLDMCPCVFVCKASYSFLVWGMWSVSLSLRSKQRAVNYTSIFLGAYYEQVAQTLQGHWSQLPFLSHSTAGQIHIYMSVCV